MGVNWDSGLLRWKDHAPGTIERYPLSHPHPFIQRIELESAGIRSAVAVDLYISLRRCEFARGFNGQVNYVTVETTDGKRYAAFFDLRRFKKVGPHWIHLMVQSAYILDPDKPAPGKGRIHFHALLGHVLRGTRPRRPA
jgi:hypothetical protein